MEPRTGEFIAALDKSWFDMRFVESDRTLGGLLAYLSHRPDDAAGASALADYLTDATHLIPVAVARLLLSTIQTNNSRETVVRSLDWYSCEYVAAMARETELAARVLQLEQDIERLKNRIAEIEAGGRR